MYSALYMTLVSVGAKYPEVIQSSGTYRYSPKFRLSHTLAGLHILIRIVPQIISCLCVNQTGI